MGQPATTDLLERYERIRRPAEVAFWVVLFGVNALANSIVASLDLQRHGMHVAAWEPWVWEWTSNMVLLALIPAVVAFDRRFPLTFEQWRRHLAPHIGFSVVVSLVHVGAMVAARTAIYAAAGEQYDFGPWPRELFYEYLKDGRGYASLLATIYLYRLLLLRLHGEARLLAEPDVGAPVEPVARPERFLVKKLGKEFLLPAGEIEWAQAWGNYVNLHVRGRDHPLRSTMSALESRLDPVQFVRVHRSWIVNLAQVAAIEPQDSGDADLLLHDGRRVPCSRTYRETLRQRLNAAAEATA